MLERMSFRGDNLRIARYYSGLTLLELGDAVKVKKQYVQQLEIGKKQPTSELVSAISAVLGFRPGFFCRELRYKVKSEDCHFRTLKSLLQYHKDWFSAYATLFVYLLEFLDERLGLPPYTVPNIPVSTDADIENAAEACREAWGIPKNAPIKSMTRIMEAAGVPIASFSGVSDKLDAFSWAKGRRFIVRSLDKNSGTRSRLDLAHECGHLVMHQEVEPGQEIVESQAFRFAGAFLLPREAFIREFPKSGWLDWQPLFALKARWGVSLGAISRRAFDIGLIDGARYRWACVDLACRGWRQIEPHEIPIETTELLPRAFEALRSGQRLNPRQVSLQLDLEPKVLEKITGIAIPKLSLAT
jgi:Zn-dependent peptidase ImmA (M78 family)/transcriptional regulator with XRE-family HTH domain